MYDLKKLAWISDAGFAMIVASSVIYAIEGSILFVMAAGNAMVWLVVFARFANYLHRKLKARTHGSN